MGNPAIQSPVANLLDCRANARNDEQKPTCDERGQSLVELPFVVMLVCALALILLQPVVTLYTKMALGQVAAELSRVVATAAKTPSERDTTLLSGYAADKLEGLPKGSAFLVPGSLRVEVSGNAQASTVTVRLVARQKPLPLFAFLGRRNAGGTIEVSAQASAAGSRCGVEGSPADAPQVFGKVD